MHIASRVTHPLQSDRRARVLLGGDHPLVHALHRTSFAHERSYVVSALLAGSAVAWLEGVHGALGVLLASAVVQIALACDVAVLVRRRRECARDLIIEGRGELPLEAVQRERRRLEDPAHRADLAHGLEAIREIAAHPASWPPAARPLFRVGVVAAVDRELAEVAVRLREERVGVRGVAMLERLITDGTSPLYGDRTRPLCEELHRISFLLGR
jgi:hypothetical protein